MKNGIHLFIISSFIAGLSLARAGYGCAACFGDKDSPMTHGMNAGIFVLLGFIGLMLASFATFFLYLRWRAKHPILETLQLEPEQLTES